MVAVLFALGLMAKPQIITFPFVLLLWDYWPLRRMVASGRAPTRADSHGKAFPQQSFAALVEEKIPLFADCCGQCGDDDEGAAVERRRAFARRRRRYRCALSNAIVS